MVSEIPKRNLRSRSSSAEGRSEKIPPLVSHGTFTGPYDKKAGRSQSCKIVTPSHCNSAMTKLPLENISRSDLETLIEKAIDIATIVSKQEPTIYENSFTYFSQEQREFLDHSMEAIQSYMPLVKTELPSHLCTLPPLKGGCWDAVTKIDGTLANILDYFHCVYSHGDGFKACSICLIGTDELAPLLRLIYVHVAGREDYHGWLPRDISSATKEKKRKSYIKKTYGSQLCQGQPVPQELANVIARALKMEIFLFNNRQKESCSYGKDFSKKIALGQFGGHLCALIPKDVNVYNEIF